MLFKVEINHLLYIYIAPVWGVISPKIAWTALKKEHAFKIDFRL